ncbi:hypothetical protein AB0N28_30550 [Streptomyces sp. NPDC051130]|uniref:hypothetical protein n=1 Tax=Streptomyces sp. NPDC051130 TaxID=3157223 RepID=UPI00342F0A7C
MKAKTTTAAVGRTVAAGALCALLAACGTRVAGTASPSAAPAPPTCAPNLPTEEETGTTPNVPTEEETGTTPNVPTEEETGTTPNVPTEEDTGGPPNPPTDQDDGTPGPPTDGGPACQVVDGWYDMTRDFNEYYARHRTDEDTFMPAGSVSRVRIRKTARNTEAWITFSTGAVGKGEGEDARRVAAVFGAWRREVFGDRGTVGVRTEREVKVTTTW